MRKQFVKTLKHILHQDNNSILLLGDIGVFAFNEELKSIPERVYNIGILEQSTISLAAGLSKSNLVPFVHTIAPFLVERAFEQLKIDFGYQKLNGNFISVGSSYDYAGLGCTHHCPGDVSLLLTIEDMSIIIPGNSKELDQLLLETYSNNNPKYFRLSEFEHELNLDVQYGKANIIKTGSKATVICYGPMLQQVFEATKNLDVTLLYYSTLWPFDEKVLLENFNSKIIICEPFYQGTTNYIISNILHNETYNITNIGIPRKFLHNYGSKHEHDVKLGLDIDNINTKNKIMLKLIYDQYTNIDTSKFEFLNNKTIVLTGASGLIGINLLGF
jgi:transketolase